MGAKQTRFISVEQKEITKPAKPAKPANKTKEYLITVTSIDETEQKIPEPPVLSKKQQLYEKYKDAKRDIELLMDNKSSSMMFFKEILTSESLYMEKMFSIGMKESVKEQIELDEIYEHVQMLLDILDPLTPKPITTHNVCIVLVMSYKYAFIKVMEKCIDFIDKTICPFNFTNMLEYKRWIIFLDNIKTQSSVDIPFSNSINNLLEKLLKRFNDYKFIDFKESDLLNIPSDIQTRLLFAVKVQHTGYMLFSEQMYRDLQRLGVEVRNHVGPATVSHWYQRLVIYLYKLHNLNFDLHSRILYPDNAYLI